jgi:hypothetical protein
MPQSRRAAAASTLHGSAACRRRAGLRGTASEAKRVTATNMKKLRQRHAKSAKSPGSLRSPGIAANLHRPASAVPASQCSMAHTASYQRMRGGRSRWRVRIRAAAHTMDSSTRRESSPRRQTLIAIPQASRSTGLARGLPLCSPSRRPSEHRLCGSMLIVSWKSDHAGAAGALKKSHFRVRHFGGVFGRHGQHRLCAVSNIIARKIVRAIWNAYASAASQCSTMSCD